MNTANIVLSDDQQQALSAFNRFLMDPNEPVFVLSGYAGCGKTTLVRTILDRLEAMMRTIRLINPNQPDYNKVALTATTNKAAENLQQITGWPATTIHAFLGLRVVRDENGNTVLQPRLRHDLICQHIVFIDESSYIDSSLMKLIFQRIDPKTSKIVFIGDPAQLTPVKGNTTPVFHANFPGAQLTTVVRQDLNSPIVDLATKFRHTVNTGRFFNFTPDGSAVQRLGRDDFDQEIIREFTRPDWRFEDSKFLAWTNKRVIAYNNAIHALVKGSPNFNVGDYAICNSFLSLPGKSTIKTDEMVHITGIAPNQIQCSNVPGRMFELNGTVMVFVPDSYELRKKALKDAREAGDIRLATEIETQWADLRAAYACTINKAQGSTYDKVFIDLDDIRGCSSGDQIARLMYVAVSRARSRVYLTGDLV